MGEMGGNAENFRMPSDMHAMVDIFCSHLQKTWQETGYGVAMQQMRGEKVCRFFRSSMRDILIQEKEVFKKTKENVKALSSDIQRLCQELSLQPFQAENLPLYETEKRLQEKFENLRQEKERQVQTLQTLRKVEAELCAELSAPIYRLVESKPLPQQVQNIRQYISVLQLEKEKKMTRFKFLWQDTADLMKTTEFSPPAWFSELADPPSLRAAADSIHPINQLKEKLEPRQEEMRREGDVLRRKLSNLWEQLRTEPAHRDNFLTRHSQDKPSSLRAFRREIDRCSSELRQKVSHLIEYARLELQELWNTCHASQEHRDKVDAYHHDHFGEDLLALYHKELETWRSYQTRWAHLFQAIETLKATWQKLKDFRLQSSDPKRFANRRGFLLQEEKSRRRLNRELQEAEGTLQTLASEYDLRGEWPLRVEGHVRPTELVHYFRAKNESESRARKLSFR